MVQQLIYGIQVHDNLNITLAKTKFKDDKLGNCIGAVSYMATKVTEFFVFAKGKNNQGCGGDGRRISAVEGHGQGHGGRGKSRGRGRGRRLSDGPFFNGVDCQYFKRRFRPSKMEQIGAEGNSYINQKCTEANKKIYGDNYRSRSDVKEMATRHSGNQEEEEEEEYPSKKPKSKKGGRNGNAFVCANNVKVV